MTTHKKLTILYYGRCLCDSVMRSQRPIKPIRYMTDTKKKIQNALESTHMHYEIIHTSCKQLRVTTQILTIIILRKMGI
jgi:hypothetical protein